MPTSQQQKSKGMDQTFSEEYIHMTIKFMKSGSNTGNNQGNTIQNHNETPFYTVQDGYYQKVIISVEKDVERWKVSFIAGGNVNCCNHFGRYYGNFLES